MLAGRPTDRRACIVCNIYETWGIYHAYAEQASGTLVALIGSSGRLELAIVARQRRRAVGRRRRHAGDGWRGSEKRDLDCRFGIAFSRRVHAAIPVDRNADASTPQDLRDWDRTLRLARLHADGRVRAVCDRAGRRLRADRYRRQPSISTASAACGATSTAIAIRRSTRPFERNSIRWRTSRTSAARTPPRSGWPSGWSTSPRRA